MGRRRKPPTDDGVDAQLEGVEQRMFTVVWWCLENAVTSLIHIAILCSLFDHAEQPSLGHILKVVVLLVQEVCGVLERALCRTPSVSSLSFQVCRRTSKGWAVVARRRRCVRRSRLSGTCAYPNPFQGVLADR